MGRGANIQNSDLKSCLQRAQGGKEHNKCFLFSSTRKDDRKKIFIELLALSVVGVSDQHSTIQQEMYAELNDGCLSITLKNTT